MIDVLGLSLDCLWTVSRLSLDCFWTVWTVSGLSLDYLWAVSRVALEFLWTVSGHVIKTKISLKPKSHPNRNFTKI